MHDLNTIHRLNVEAFAESIANYRKQGRYVLAKFPADVALSDYINRKTI